MSPVNSCCPQSGVVSAKCSQHCMQTQLEQIFSQSLITYIVDCLKLSLDALSGNAQLWFAEAT